MSLNLSGSLHGEHNQQPSELFTDVSTCVRLVGQFCFKSSAHVLSNVWFFFSFLYDGFELMTSKEECANTQERRYLGAVAPWIIWIKKTFEFLLHKTSISRTFNQEISIVAICLLSVYEFYNPNFMSPVTVPHFKHSFSPITSRPFDKPSFETIPSADSKISCAPISLQNNVLLATRPQSCRVTSCTQELRLCRITVEITRVGKGFVLPLRTPIAVESTTGIFSCCLCWRADRRAHRGFDVSPTAGSWIFPIVNLQCLNQDEWCSLLLLWFLI